MDRDDILKAMLSGVSPALGGDQEKRVMSAMKAFSVKQLQKMEEAGVRIWPFVKGLPPEFQINSIGDLGSPAEYKYQFRTIRISPTSMEKAGATDFLRHEFAHAWDEVRAGKGWKNLRKLKGDAISDELNRRATDKADVFESQSARKLLPSNKTMKEIFENYKKVLPDKTYSFANPSTAEMHNTRNVMEFYAEGYSVFHGFHQTSQGRMMWLAPGLFGYLEKEAKDNGLPAPQRAELEKVLDDNHKDWRKY